LDRRPPSECYSRCRPGSQPVDAVALAECAPAACALRPLATFHQSAERAQQYLVVGNHGPSEDRNLSVTFSRGGKTWVPGWNGGKDSPFPIQALAPGNPLGLGCWGNWTEGKAGLAIATITWRDGRRRTQTTRTTLSIAGLPVGGWGGKTLAELDRGLGWRMRS